jgi:hypothetical protein
MKNISDWIDTIIEDLVNPKIKLSDTLLKVQVLAFKLENQELKDWVDGELNGYVGKDRPEYRRIPPAVFGNLMQDVSYQILTRKNYPLPIEYLDKETADTLRNFRMDSKIAELESMVEKEGSYQVNLPHFICQEFSELTSPWIVDTAWQKIPTNNIQGIISTVKSVLLNFLLELNKKIGNDSDLSILKKQNEVDEVFDKTIGSISGENVHITIGNKNMSSQNYGDSSHMVNAQGKNINQKLDFSQEQMQDVKELVKFLKEELPKLGLQKLAKEDVIGEIKRVETQLGRESPNNKIIESSLNTIYDILVGVTSNAYSPIILERIQAFLNSIG